MPKLKHIHLDDYPYMATTVSFNREPLFADKNAASILMACLLFGKKEGWYYLLSFVIMPDHLHVIVTPNRKNITGIMKSIKGFSARKINELYDRNGSIWQDGYFDYVLDREEIVLSKTRYIEDNPVRKGLVQCPEEYSFSSAKCRDLTDFGLFF